MSIVAPHVRKHLSADALFHLVRSGFAGLPGHRLDETARTLTNWTLASFAVLRRLTQKALQYWEIVTHLRCLLTGCLQ